MKAIPVPEIDGVYLFEPTPHPDQRGFFSRTFDREVVASVGINPDGFAQDSLSRSRKGVVRGMHLRGGAGEAKLVRCSHGAVLDVVVDLRPDSPTFRAMKTFELSGTPGFRVHPGGVRARVPVPHRSLGRVVPHRPRRTTRPKTSPFPTKTRNSPFRGPCRSP